METQNLDIDPDIKQSFVDDGITELNPPQEDAVDAGVLEGEDMVVASPTASGKTLVAELALTKKTVEGDGMTVYVVPLKALASEKYEDFSERYEDLDVRMSVGDYDSGGDNLDAADVLIATSEKLDSLLRHSPSWISRIDLVVVDEIHLLNSTNRGPTLEVTLTKLRDTLDFQLLGLSATISNAFEMAGWLDAELVESDYRPVELEQAVAEAEHLEYYDPDEHSVPQDDAPSDSSFSKASDHEKGFEPEREVELVGESRETPVRVVEDTLDKDKQAIVFTSSRKGAEKSSDRNAEVVEQELSRQEKEELDGYADQVLNALGSPTSQCRRLAENLRKGAAFHHAGLVVSQRKLVEEAFRKGLVKTVSATPTLAAGVNLPAFRVVIRDLKRYTGSGMDFIPVLEYEQMCLPPEQEVVMPGGARDAIENICAEPGTAVASSNGEEVTESDVKNTFQKPRCEVLRVETETGSFKATPDHEFLAREGDGFSWKPLEELEHGDLLKSEDLESGDEIPTVSLVPGSAYAVGGGEVLEEYKKDNDLTDAETARSLDIPESTVYHYRKDKKAVPFHGYREACRRLGISDKEAMQRLDGVKSEQGSPVNLPGEVTANLMWLIGLVITDGNLNRTEDSRHGSTYTSIRIFNTDERIVDRAESVFRQLGLEAYREERGNMMRLEVGNTLLAEILNTRFGVPYGKKSSRTRIPEIVFRAEPKLQGAYISGVFDGDGSYFESEYKQRVLFSTSSEEFADQLRHLLGELGCKSRRNSEYIDEILIDGEEYRVDRKSIRVSVRDKNSVSKLSELLNPAKGSIPSRQYSNYHNSNEHRRSQTDTTKILQKETVGERKVYDIETEPEHNYLLPGGVVAHNCGRAGRPGFDDRGEAISVAKNPGMTGEIVERYIAGEPEKIRSKLAAEPVLRMHTLSLVASRYTKSREELLEFFEETFYAYQFGDFSEIERKLDSTVEDLRDYGFIEEDGFEATDTGERVAELYIDPDSANLMLESLRAADRTDETRPVSYLFMLARTSEMAPRPNLKSGEGTEIERALQDARTYLLESVPQEWDPSYDLYLECMKLALMLRAWISEVDEERIMEKYGVAPGGVRAKNRNADWLLYSAQELCRLEDIDQEEELERLRRRMRHGIKEELLPLVKFDQIGRVRARKLMEHGIDTQQRIREVRFEKLKKLIGDSTARTLKEQVGEENIFDRENIMDYFDE